MPVRPHALTALALAGLLAGCGGGATAAPTATGTTSGGPTAAAADVQPTTTTPAPTSPVAAATTACTTPADPVPTTGPAAAAFGADAVAAGYAFGSDLLARTTFTEAPLDQDHPQPDAFATAEQGLTPRARDSLRELTTKLAAPAVEVTPQENADLLGLSTYGVAVSYPGHTLRDPAYRDVTCGRATTEVLERPGLPDALVLRFPVSGTYLLDDPAGVPQTLVFTKQMGLSLAPTDDPARPWLLDGWRADLALDGPKPDTAP